MPITGSQKAVHYAIMDSAIPAGCRIGDTRLDYYVPRLLVEIAGTRSTRSLRRSIRIEDNIDAAPNTAQLTTRSDDAVTAAIGNAITIGLGTTANPIFKGRILSQQVISRKADSRRMRRAAQCIDFSWEADFKRHTGQQWTDTSATTIAQDVIATMAPTFTARVEANLATVTGPFVVTPLDKLSDVLNRLAGRIGGYWYVDYDRSIRFYVTTTQRLANITSSSDLLDLDADYDYSQVRNRMIVVGGGSQAAQAAAVGASTLYLDDVGTFFSA